MQSYRLTLLLHFALLALTCASARAADDFYLRDGQRVVFFGDSITQAGVYVDYVDAFLRTRFPDKSFEIINHGISSETVSGTSETDHNPRRPDAHERFARDVAAWKPDVVVACFGMNDGNYFPPDAARFAKYQGGIQRLIARTRDEAHAHLVLMSPPPFDAYRRTSSDPNAKEFGYKFPAINYDDTLTGYSDWLLTLHDKQPDKQLVVADVHGSLANLLSKRRVGQVSFSFSPDAVHPNETGHWLMAQALLEAWHAPAEAGSLTLDAAAKTVVAGTARELERTDKALECVWQAPLPLPIDPRWDARCLELAQMAERLNHSRLVVRGLPSGRYRLLANGQPLGEVDHDQLQAGVDMLAYANFPTVLAAGEVLKLVQERNQSIYKGWRASLAPGAVDQALADKSREQDKQLRELCRPREVKLRVEAIAK